MIYVQFELENSTQTGVPSNIAYRGSLIDEDRVISPVHNPHPTTDTSFTLAEARRSYSCVVVKVVVGVVHGVP